MPHIVERPVNRIYRRVATEAVKLLLLENRRLRTRNSELEADSHRLRTERGLAPMPQRRVRGLWHEHRRSKRWAGNE